MAARSAALELGGRRRRSPRPRPGRRRRAGSRAARRARAAGSAPRRRSGPSAGRAPRPATRTSSSTRPLDAIETDGSSGRHMAPSAETTRSAASSSRCARTKAGRCGAADLLLALEQELDVERQPALLGEQRLGRLDRDSTGPLSSVTPRARRRRRRARRLERRRLPLGQRRRAAARRSARRPAWSARPAAPSHSPSTTGWPLALDDAAAGEGELRGEPSAAARMASRWSASPADAGDRARTRPGSSSSRRRPAV